MKFSAILFDMDGTIIDTMVSHYHAWVEVLKELGLDLPVHEVARYLGGTNAENLARLKKDFNLDFDSDAISDRKEFLWRAIVKKDLELIPGFCRFITRAQQAGIRTALATMAPMENVDLVLDLLELRERFDTVVTAEEVKNGKPHPDVFLLAAERLRIPVKDCVVFEDSQAGIEAARRANMPAVLVATMRHHPPKIDHSVIIKVIDDFTDLDPTNL